MHLTGLRIRGFKSFAEPVELRVVVVAARDIAARKPLEEGDVVTRSVPADVTNDSAYTLIEDVLGRVSSVPILTGQLVTRNALASTAAGQGYAILDAGETFDLNGPDLRAVSISVPAASKSTARSCTPGNPLSRMRRRPV